MKRYKSWLRKNLTQYKHQKWSETIFSFSSHHSDIFIQQNIYIIAIYFRIYPCICHCAPDFKWVLRIYICVCEFLGSHITSTICEYSNWKFSLVFLSFSACIYLILSWLWMCVCMSFENYSIKMFKSRTHFCGGNRNNWKSRIVFNLRHILCVPLRDTYVCVCTVYVCSKVLLAPSSALSTLFVWLLDHDYVFHLPCSSHCQCLRTFRWICVSEKKNLNSH